jgi:hypothetical protein
MATIKNPDLKKVGLVNFLHPVEDIEPESSHPILGGQVLGLP